MASGHRGAALRRIRQVFAQGSVSSLSEGELLDRFLQRRDATAFDALVAQHGPMVWGVCRRLIRDPHDAEDAFQATFLILLVKAGSLRDPGGLGPWLYGVARRVALRARSDAARRRAREARAARSEAVTFEPVAEPDRMILALDEEIRRLPDRYRRPVILCHLQGLSYEEAARRLRWTTRMVKGRLARARERLRTGLKRRGLSPELGALGGAVLVEPASTAVPVGLADSTLGMLSRSAADGPSAVSARVLALAEEAKTGMILGKLTLVSSAVLALIATSVLVWASVRTVVGSDEGIEREERAALSHEEPPALGSRESAPVQDVRRHDSGSTRPMEPSGVVVLPDGRPADGATVALATRDQPLSITNGTLARATWGPSVTTGKDGRFRFATPTRAYLLVALHEKGYADARSDDFARTSRLVLMPWGRLVGQVLVQRRPASGAGIVVAALRPGSEEGLAPAASCTTKTDELGRFSLDEVIPGPSAVSRLLVTEYGSRGRTLRPCWPELVDVKPGETTEVQLGGKGRSVVGQVLVKGVDPGSADWADNEPVLLRRWLGPPLQIGLYGANLDRAGRFRIVDVPPGRYELEIPKNGPATRARTGPGPEMGRARRTVDIPETQGGKGDEPFDLGTIEVKLLSPARDPAQTP